MLLPNGCSCSTPTIHPANWRTGGVSLLKKKWFLQYYFRDPAQPEEFQNRWPYGKPIRIQFSRGLKTLQEFRDTAKAILDNEIRMLQQEGYNPITGISFIQEALPSDIPDSTKLAIALTKAAETIKANSTTKRDIKSVLKYSLIAIRILGLSEFPVGQIRKKHIKLLLEQLAVLKKEKWTANNYNAYRKYLSMLFTELIEFEAIEFNPVNNIPKKVVTKKIRETLSREQRKKVDIHLRKKKLMTFRLYCRLFFHSGIRTTEMLSLQGKHIHLDRQVIRVTVKKGKQYVEVEKPIKNIAVRYWKLAMHHCKANDFVFSVGLKPGDKMITPSQITRRWETHVKAPVDKGGLGIEVDFYAFKHGNTTEMVDIAGESAAAELNSHKSEAMVRKIYDTKRISREHQKIRDANNYF